MVLKHTEQNVELTAPVCRGRMECRVSLLIRQRTGQRWRAGTAAVVLLLQMLRDCRSAGWDDICVAMCDDTVQKFARVSREEVSMAVAFDLEPTARLSGLHMMGTVQRRFLISYPVPPEALLSYLPPGAECSTHDGSAWVSACFVRMGDMRPNILPRFAGMGFNYLIHRTRARLPFPDGQLREAVLVLQPNINRPILSCFGSLLTGIGFQTRDVEFHEQADGWQIRMLERDEVLFDASILKSGCSAELPGESRFRSVTEADRFLLGVSFGGQWKPGESVLKLLPETHDPWISLGYACVTHCNRFLEHLGVQSSVADHAIMMQDVTHYFGITPLRTILGGDQSE